MLRIVALTIAFAGIGFWLYTFYGIAQAPVGDGSGMQWVAAMPLGLIFFLLVVPALGIAWSGRWLWLSILLGAAGLIAFGFLWRQILGELYG
jgi:hypothetical protein